RKIDWISSEDMLELAASGSKVLLHRCVEYARRYNIPIHVRLGELADCDGGLVLVLVPAGCRRNGGRCPVFPVWCRSRRSRPRMRAGPTARAGSDFRRGGCDERGRPGRWPDV
ncbi:hypothetical protein, partial [Streptomyces yangpuensis]|uniref:hypothetical protein n=1 Tax=Streptomyces yangpuensis TaxID=1648182 RepID=UPI00365656FE